MRHHLLVVTLIAAVLAAFTAFAYASADAAGTMLELDSAQMQSLFARSGFMQ